MGLSTTKVKGVRVPLANSAPTIVADLTGMRDDIVARGNRMAITSTQRAALPAADQWTGLEVFETDTGKTFLRRAGGFEQVMQAIFKAMAPFGALGDSYPATDADPLIRIGYGRFAPLGASGQGTLTFPDAFPNRCALLLAITIEGSAVNPVVSAGNLSRTGATLVWQGGNTSTTVRFLYLAIGF